MKKLNQSLKLAVFVSLFTLPFLISCSERDREMRFPHTDIPESVTVMIKHVPEGASFDLDISTDYSQHKDNLGAIVIVHNYSEEYTVTQNFNKTFPLEVEEPTIDLGLICTHVGSTSEDSSDSIRLIIRFNGDGNFYRGNHNEVLPVKVGTTINVRSRFSRYDGTSKSVSSSKPNGS
ncbi:MAG: hypothetical protein OXM61_19530 [Candidatus Poribacteria bacterium]|nr:hypothetical protein [Candidatus Poribacteria bacterium]